MPVIFSKHLANLAHIALWKIEESEAELAIELELSDADQQRFVNIKTARHRKQWLASRVLLYQVFPEANIFYASSGKPLLLNGPHLSISHTEGYAAVIINPIGSTGVDVQHYDEKLDRISRKFVHEEEKKIINDSNDPKACLHLIWNIKECLFKLHGSKLAFKDQIRVEPFSVKDEIVRARVIKNGEENLHQLEIMLLPNASMAYVA